MYRAEAIGFITASALPELEGRERYEGYLMIALTQQSCSIKHGSSTIPTQVFTVDTADPIQGQKPYFAVTS
jgi:hypothetical protein